LSILGKHFNEINEPDQWPLATQPGFEGVVGAIDCTSHFRCRVHPRQGDYYRGDKGGHFLTAQVMFILLKNTQTTTD